MAGLGAYSYVAWNQKKLLCDFIESERFQRDLHSIIELSAPRSMKRTTVAPCGYVPNSYLRNQTQGAILSHDHQRERRVCDPL